MEGAHRLDQPHPRDGRCVHRPLLRHQPDSSRPRAEDGDAVVCPGVRLRCDRRGAGCLHHQGRPRQIRKMTMAEAAEQHPAASAGEIEYPDRPEGPISAAIIAGGDGALALGAVTTLAEASTSVKDSLEWSE